MRTIGPLFRVVLSLSPAPCLRSPLALSACSALCVPWPTSVHAFVHHHSLAHPSAFRHLFILLNSVVIHAHTRGPLSRLLQVLADPLTPLGLRLLSRTTCTLTLIRPSRRTRKTGPTCPRRATDQEISCTARPSTRVPQTIANTESYDWKTVSKLAWYTTQILTRQRRVWTLQWGTSLTL